MPELQRFRLAFGRRRTVLGVAFIALIVAAAGFAIYRQRHSFVDALDKIGAGAMIGSFAAATVGVGLVFFIWREVLTGLKVDMPWRIGARAFFTSQLGKYLPGSVWPVLVQMEAGKARGASRRTMLAANLITVVLSCAVGLIIAAALLPISDTHALSHYWWLLLVLPFLIALLHPRALPMVLDRVFALLHRPPLDERLPVRNTVRAAAWSVGSFILQGLHIAILALTLGGGGFLDRAAVHRRDVARRLRGRALHPGSGRRRRARRDPDPRAAVNTQRRAGAGSRRRLTCAADRRRPRTRRHRGDDPETPGLIR